MGIALEMLLNLLRSDLKPELNYAYGDLGLPALHLTSLLPPESHRRDMGAVNGPWRLLLCQGCVSQSSNKPLGKFPTAFSLLLSPPRENTSPCHPQKLCWWLEIQGFLRKKMIHNPIHRCSAQPSKQSLIEFSPQYLMRMTASGNDKFLTVHTGGGPLGKAATAGWGI